MVVTYRYLFTDGWTVNSRSSSAWRIMLQFSKKIREKQLVKRDFPRVYFNKREKRIKKIWKKFPSENSTEISNIWPFSKIKLRYRLFWTVCHFMLLWLPCWVLLINNFDDNSWTFFSEFYEPSGFRLSEVFKRSKQVASSFIIREISFFDIFRIIGVVWIILNSRSNTYLRPRHQWAITGTLV